MKTSRILIISIVAGILAIGTSCTSKKDETTAEKQDVKKAVPVKNGNGESSVCCQNH